MALTASKVVVGPVVTSRANNIEPCGNVNSFTKSIHHSGLHTSHRVEYRRSRSTRLLAVKLTVFSEPSWKITVKPCIHTAGREDSFSCRARETRNTEAKEILTQSDDFSDVSRDKEVEELLESISHEHSIADTSYSSQGFAEVFKYVYNDAKFVNERARNDIVLLSRGITRLNDRACQDAIILGTEFLKLDARAREDTEKIDHGVKEKAESLHHIAKILKDKAQSKLKSVAEQHWNDGALEADLRRADFLAKRRAMEDSFMALEFVKDIHDMMVTKMYKLPLRRRQGSSSGNAIGDILLEKNGRTAGFFPGEISSDRIAAIQEAYWSMASAFSEADGIDYTDPEELELLVGTLIDLDAMDGKSSVSLLAECSNSPDASTRQALANALSAAPSMWTLGNAGMGALQRLAEDKNPMIAAAASRTINELKKQWEIEEGDSLRFMMNQIKRKEETEDDREENDKDMEKD